MNDLGTHIMFTDGRIKTYDAVRGTGSIELANNAQELNFQLDQLPSPEIAPQVGERLKFRIIEEQNTIQLDNMVRLDIKRQEEFVSEVVALPSLASTTIVNSARNTIFFSPTLWLILVTAIGFMIFGEI